LHSLANAPSPGTPALDQPHAINLTRSTSRDQPRAAQASTHIADTEAGLTGNKRSINIVAKLIAAAQNNTRQNNNHRRAKQ
jgi:hypothetical protein